MGINTGRSIVYSLKPEEWSLHYALSPDGTCFGGDGGSGARGISPPGTGKWIYLYRRRLDGTLAVERLVNLSYHDYVIEPNVRFTPDGRWLIFAANLRGALQVYAVEITRASGDAGR
jgi:oligogalacturonide lyase